MKNFLLVIMTFLFCLLFICISGCTDVDSTGDVEEIQSPEKVFNRYFFGYVMWNENMIRGVLSSDANAKNSENSIQNIIYSMASKGIKPINYDIVSLDMDLNKATMKVSVTSDLKGFHQTNTKVIPFVFENEEWKIDEFVLLI